MKTTIEVSGFEIKIEEMEGKVSVTAEKEGEVVEEFVLETEEGMGEEGMEGDEMSAFGEEEEEEGDFGDEEEEDEMEEDEMEEEEEGKLESFSHFVKSRKK